MKLQHRAEFLFGAWRVVVVQEDGMSAAVIGRKYSTYTDAQREADRLNGVGEQDKTIILLALAASVVLMIAVACIIAEVG